MITDTVTLNAGIATRHVVDERLPGIVRLAHDCVGSAGKQVGNICDEASGSTMEHQKRGIEATSGDLGAFPTTFEAVISLNLPEELLTDTNNARS